MTVTTLDPASLLRPRRQITGMSAILLPYDSSGNIVWGEFDEHVLRTAKAGLTPAVNMDTGYVNLLDDSTRLTILQRTSSLLAGQPFVAGAFLGDSPDDPFDLDAYLRQIEPIAQHGGTPILFQSYGLVKQDDEGIVTSYAAVASRCDRFLGFELGTMFAPFGAIYSLEVYRGLIDLPQCAGAKHSSLQREPEWQRLALRDERRPDFMVLTGNDLAIDMVKYGSDYLLGLSTFDPVAFAHRDALWAAGDEPGFTRFNDVLQRLGDFAFREPVPAYKHSAAMFLKHQGWFESDATHPESALRPASDRAALKQILDELTALG